MTLELNDQQVAYVMQVLAQRPLAEALELFTAIQQQAQAQAQQQRQPPHLQPVSG